jgi:4-amino-4-deoxychorismate lyase
MTPDLILIDGKCIAVPAVSALDRGLHFGDGLFETMAVQKGRVRFLALHLERLKEGCGRLGIDAGNFEAIWEEAVRVAKEQGRALLKLIVTRGEAVARGYGPKGAERTTRVLLRYAWPADSEARGAAGEGVPPVLRVGVASIRLGENPALAGLKHLNRLEQVLASRERQERGLDELLLFSSSGRLVSGTMSNVFLVHRDKLLTPRLDLCGVAGIMRRVVLREAARIGVLAEESVLDRHDLDAATEIFLTNARWGIQPARIGPLTQRLKAAIEPLLEEPADG